MKQIYLFRCKKKIAPNVCVLQLLPTSGTPTRVQEDQFLDSDGAASFNASTHGALFLIEDVNVISGAVQGKQLKAIPFSWAMVS